MVGAKEIDADRDRSGVGDDEGGEVGDEIAVDRDAYAVGVVLDGEKAGLQARGEGGGV